MFFHGRHGRLSLCLPQEAKSLSFLLSLFSVPLYHPMFFLGNLAFFLGRQSLPRTQEGLLPRVLQEKDRYYFFSSAFFSFFGATSSMLTEPFCTTLQLICEISSPIELPRIILRLRRPSTSELKPMLFDMRNLFLIWPSMSFLIGKPSLSEPPVICSSYPSRPRNSPLSVSPMCLPNTGESFC